MKLPRAIGGLTLAALLAAGILPPASASEAAEQLLGQADRVRSSQPQEFARLLRQLDLRSDLEPDQQELLRYLHAYAAAYRGRYEESMALSLPLAQHAEDSGVRLRAGALLVNSYAVTRQFAAGLRQLNTTMAGVSNADQEVREHVLHVAAMLYNSIGQYRIGRSYADQVLALPGLGTRTRCFSSELRFQAQQSLGELSNDDSALRQAIQQCLAIREPIVANLMRGILARKLAAEGNSQQAIALLQSALPEIEATQFPNLIGQMHSLLGELLAAERKDVDAERHALLAVRHAGDIERSLSLIAAYRTLYEVAERRGDMRSALRYYRLYADADVDYLSEVNAREMAFQVVRQELQQKGQQIALLNHKNRVLQLQRQVEQQSARNMQMLVGLLALLVAAIGYWAYRVKRMEHTLRRRTETDALTGVASRQHLARCVERQLQKDAAHGTDSALIMFDLDNFKACNDRHGHEMGDWALVRAAQACAALRRDGDLIGRLGGEEFAMFLPGASQAEALRMAEACRRSIEAIDSGDTGHAIAITASFGVAMAGAAGHDLTALLSRADKALYRAKHDGRNCVRAYEEGMASGHADAPRLRLAHPAVPQPLH